MLQAGMKAQCDLSERVRQLLKQLVSDQQNAKLEPVQGVCLAESRKDSAAPSTPHMIPDVALFTEPKGPSRLPALQHILTSMLSTVIMPVMEACRENLPLILEAKRPHISFSNRKPQRWPSSSPHYKQVGHSRGGDPGLIGSWWLFRSH
ncbi:hypothetical protein P7K49_020135 [Saguinus oedipus]|uniref:Uncharacterized protein n=1 Tax=Saguinus oedipus TaxID=9490 RepID=A0ABQ9UZC4_SAGOE|nr:hypothetical protein P7K49_020135 [Saguinus oedipus]